MTADRAARDTDAPNLEPQPPQRPKPRSGPPDTSAQEFASLAAARKYIDSIRETTTSFGETELVDALKHVDAAYRQFPELELEQPSEVLIQNLPQSVLLSALCIFFRSREVRWSVIKPIVGLLLEQAQEDMILEVISSLLQHLQFSQKKDAAELGDVLRTLLDDSLPLQQNSAALGEAVLSGRRRLTLSPHHPHQQGLREAVLAMAERLGSASPRDRRNPHTALAWPSGQISFDEFLLQWPSEVHLPTELNEASFVDEAYQAILLREPNAIEVEQYLNLIQDGVSRPWILQDVLASEEFRSLDRRLRVIWSGYVITAPGNYADQEVPAITWRFASGGG